MKIIFLCGSLEPGHDGVGDYIRRLGVEMIKQGHQIAAIGLNEWHLTDEVIDEQKLENINLSVLRLPSVWPSKQKFGRAKEWIDLFDPDWLSLQFVSFAFHLKGLHFSLATNLATLGKDRRWHIMFHELWVGMAVEASIKHIIWGNIQKRMIKNLILKLKPIIIHTQCYLYLAQLQRLGFTVYYLPLFSNIPIVGNPFNKNKLRNKKISFVVFGTIHPLSPVEIFAREANVYAKENNLKISLVFIGRNGDELNRWVSVLKSENWEVALLGEQSPERISEILANSSIGLSTSSIAYIEKSGSAVAMRAHGLAVICVSKPLQLLDMKYINPPDGIMEYKEGNFAECLKIKFEIPKVDFLLEVANKLTEVFLNNNS